ncbi:hypothetical protein POPTR_003G096375v4 [Populus trichocarpa]|uniref:Uncharacterized protein n=1 Tax=Populus trichocarpa TaxID=3694 RepID=A0ACC0T976_POPTR|nr:hypothetical protein POPTR_003G096375v4 [Populus trichocarpa]
MDIDPWQHRTRSIIAPSVQFILLLGFFFFLLSPSGKKERREVSIIALILVWCEFSVLCLKVKLISILTD